MTQYSTRGSHTKKTGSSLDGIEALREELIRRQKTPMLDEPSVNLNVPASPGLKDSPNAPISKEEEIKAKLLLLAEQRFISADQLAKGIEDLYIKNEEPTKSGDEKMSNTQAQCNSKNVDIDNSDIYYNNGYQRKVSVLFAGGMKEYVYNCAFKVKKGDLVVVYANGEYKVVTVAATNVDTSFTGRLKDIIDVVDVNRYKALTEAREELQEYRDEQSRAWDLDNQMEDVDRQVEAKVLSKKQSKVVKGLIKKIKSLTD